MRVLVLDDEPLLLRVIDRSLRRQGIDVVGVTRGSELLTTLAEAAPPFNLLLLDLNVPGGEGALWVLDRLPEGAPPALVMSGMGSAQSTEELLECGFAGYVGKPFTPRELGARVLELLDD